MVHKMVVSVAAMAILYVAGVLSAARDYSMVGAEFVTQWFKKSVPLAVEIERMEQLIRQLDSEISVNGRMVVEQSVALDRQVEQVAAKEQTLTKLRQDLKALRTKFVSLDDGADKKSVESIMASRLDRFNVQSGTVKSTQAQLAEKRQAYEKMLAAFEKQKADRDALKDKLESFRAEYETMKMRGELDQSTLADSALRRAKDLSAEIQDRLTVQSRLAALEADPLPKLLSDIELESTFSLSKIDAAIESDDPCSSVQMVAR